MKVTLGITSSGIDHIDRKACYFDVDFSLFEVVRKLDLEHRKTVHSISKIICLWLKVIEHIISLVENFRIYVIVNITLKL